MLCKIELTQYLFMFKKKNIYITLRLSDSFDFCLFRTNIVWLRIISIKMFARFEITPIQTHYFRIKFESKFGTVG